MPDVIPSPTLYSEALAHCASATRHDGWTREAKVTFCEVLAITGRVVEALDAVNKSGNTAYAQRRRDPHFARARAHALSEARHRLPDSLLAPALHSTRVKEHDPPGEVIRERHIDDNRLALAVLRRLDRLAECGSATGRFVRPAADEAAADAPPATSTTRSTSSPRTTATRPKLTKLTTPSPTPGSAATFARRFATPPRSEWPERSANCW